MKLECIRLEFDVATGVTKKISVKNCVVILGEKKVCGRRKEFSRSCRIICPDPSYCLLLVYHKSTLLFLMSRSGSDCSEESAW